MAVSAILETRHHRHHAGLVGHHVRSHNACRIGIRRWAVVEDGDDVAWSVWKERLNDAPVSACHGVVEDVARDASLQVGPVWPVTVGCLKSTSVFVRASPSTKKRVVSDCACPGDICGEL
eukprot:7115479-Pyramimonas_sp.AAC.1